MPVVASASRPWPPPPRCAGNTACWPMSKSSRLPATNGRRRKWWRVNAWRYGRAREILPLISSFSMEALAIARDLAPGVLRVACCSTPCQPIGTGRCCPWGALRLHCNAGSRYVGEVLAEAAAQAVPVLCYTGETPWQRREKAVGQRCQRHVYRPARSFCRAVPGSIRAKSRADIGPVLPVIRPRCVYPGRCSGEIRRPAGFCLAMTLEIHAFHLKSRTVSIFQRR